MPFQRPTQSATSGEYSSSRERLPVHPGSDGTTPQPVDHAQYELTCRLWAPLPLRQVYRAFEDPRNLARITPPWLGFEIQSEGEIEMRRGLHIDYTIRWNGLPMGWTSIISGYDPPDSFVDEQVRGPYRYWHHYHGFAPRGEGTLISDRVRYSLPLGPLGRLAHALMVRRQLLGIFTYRQTAVAELLGVQCRNVQEPRIVRLGHGRGPTGRL